MQYTIYTDGASRGNPGPGGWGAVIVQNAKCKMQNESAKDGARNEKHVIIQSESLRSKVNDMRNDNKVVEIGGMAQGVTNNQMELRAVIEALKAMPKESSVTIIADSKYVVEGITSWIHNWMRKGWKTADKKPVLNQDLWKELFELTKGRDIKWKLIPGHSGIKYNERADEIATSFACGFTI